MKKVYAVLEVSGQGSPEPLRAEATGEHAGIHYIYRRTETFNSRGAAEERARALVREKPSKTFHIVESVQVLFSDAPVTSHTFE